MDTPVQQEKSEAFTLQKPSNETDEYSTLAFGRCTCGHGSIYHQYVRIEHGKYAGLYACVGKCLACRNCHGFVEKKNE